MGEVEMAAAKRSCTGPKERFAAETAAVGHATTPMRLTHLRSRNSMTSWLRESQQPALSTTRTIYFTYQKYKLHVHAWAQLLGLHEVLHALEIRVYMRLRLGRIHGPT